MTTRIRERPAVTAPTPVAHELAAPSSVAGQIQARPAAGWDRLLALLPAACAIHCLLTPFVAAAVPLVALGPRGEWAVFGISLALALVAVRTTWRVHGKGRVWAPVALGATIWLTSLLGWVDLAGEWEWSAGIGGLILAGGVVWSSRLRHRRVCASGRCLL